MEFHRFILSERFDQAFLLASQLHRQQKRKNIPSPFMTHLLAVTSLVCENIGFVCENSDEAEEFAMTAILHDTIEDQGGSSTYALLSEKFGPKIADYVLMLSDSIPDDPDNKPPKSERNARYLEKMKTCLVGIAVISCCDKIHNLRTMSADAKAAESLDVFWSAFSQSPQKTVQNYHRLREVYAARIPIPRLIALYDEALEAVEKLVIS